MDDSLKQPGLIEIEHNAADDCRRLMEQFKDRLTLDNLRLSERYLKQEIHVLLQFRFGDSEEYVASFQREPLDRRRDERTNETRNFSTRTAPEEILRNSLPLTWQDAVATQICIHREQQSVLVDNVELMELPEKITCTSSVWFDCVDSVYGVLPHALYSSVAHGFVFRGILGNREIHMGVRTGVTITNTNKMMSQVIEATPKVLNHVPDNQRNAVGNLRNAVEIIGALSRVRIVLKLDYISARLEEPVPLRFQFVDLLFGPF